MQTETTTKDSDSAFKLPNAARLFSSSLVYQGLSKSARYEYGRHVEMIKKFFGDWADLRTITEEDTAAYFAELDKRGASLRSTASVVLTHLYDTLNDSGFKVTQPHKHQPRSSRNTAKHLAERAQQNGTTVQEEQAG